MSPTTPTHVLTRQEHPEATVLRIGSRSVVETDAEQFFALRNVLYQESEVADRPLILDLSAVEYLSSAMLGCLIIMRKKLMQRGMSFQPPCRRRGLLVCFYRDQAEALEAVRQGAPEPLLLCGVRPEIMEIFKVCSTRLLDHDPESPVNAE